MSRRRRVVAEPRTLWFHFKRVARVMMILAAGLGPVPPPPPPPEPQGVELIMEDRNGSEED